MDNLTVAFDKLKVSALEKHKYINEYNRSITVKPATESDAKPDLSITLTKNDLRNNLNKLKNAYDFAQQKKVLHEAEIQRQKDVRNAVEKRVSNMLAESTKIREQDNKLWIEQQKKFTDRIKSEELSLQSELNNYEQSARVEHEKALQDLKLQQQMREEKVQILHQSKQLQNIEKICQKQKHFRMNYQKLVDILKACEDKHAVNKILIDHSKYLKEWPEEMDRIVQQSKKNIIDNSHFNTADDLIKKVIDLCKTIQQKVDEINNQMKTSRLEAEAAKQAVHVVEESRTPQKIEPKIILNVPSTNTQTSSNMSTAIKNTPDSSETKTQVNTRPNVENDYVSQSSLKIFISLRQFRLSFEAKYQNLVKDETYKKYRFECQKAINIPINAISAISPQHLLDKYNRLKKLLSGDVVEVGNSQVSARKHQEGIPFCMNLLAKKFVCQGDLMVASNPESAFPIAAVIVALWCDFPDFGKLILSHFQNECPYLVPMYLPQAENQTDEDYYKSLGYRYVDGEVEKQDKFLKRMSGIIRLYAAVLITKPRRGTEMHPHGLNYGWRLLACLLNMSPRLDITATILYNLLEVVGSALLNAYGKQFKKILIFLYKDYMHRLDKVDSGGPVVRLQVFLQEIIKSGTIAAPKGILHFNF